MIEEVRFGTQGGAFIEDGVNPTLAQFYPRRFPAWRVKLRPVITMNRDPEQSLGNRHPVGPLIMPEGALCMDNSSQPFCQIFPHTLREFNI